MQNYPNRNPYNQGNYPHPGMQIPPMMNQGALHSAPPKVPIVTRIGMSDWYLNQPPQGVPYFYNNLTRISSWTAPVGLDISCVAHMLPSPLPPGWAEYKAADGRTYFHHAATNTTTWTRPDVRPPAPHVPAAIATATTTTTAPATATAPPASTSTIPLSSTTQDTPISAPVVDPVAVQQALEQKRAEEKAKQKEKQQQQQEQERLAAAQRKKDKEEAHRKRQEEEAQRRAAAEEERRQKLLSLVSKSTTAVDGAVVLKGDPTQLFNDLLREKGVGSTATWSDTLPSIVLDPRYTAIKSLAEKKALFEKFKTTSLEEERMRVARDESRLKTEFINAVRSAVSPHGPSPRWSEYRSRILASCGQYQQCLFTKLSTSFSGHALSDEVDDILRNVFYETTDIMVKEAIVSEKQRRARAYVGLESLFLEYSAFGGPIPVSPADMASIVDTRFSASDGIPVHVHPHSQLSQLAEVLSHDPRWSESTELDQITVWTVIAGELQAALKTMIHYHDDTLSKAHSHLLQVGAAALREVSVGRALQIEPQECVGVGMTVGQVKECLNQSGLHAPEWLVSALTIRSHDIPPTLITPSPILPSHILFGLPQPLTPFGDCIYSACQYTDTDSETIAEAKKGINRLRELSLACPPTLDPSIYNRFKQEAGDLQAAIATAKADPNLTQSLLSPKFLASFHTEPARLLALFVRDLDAVANIWSRGMKEALASAQKDFNSALKERGLTYLPPSAPFSKVLTEIRESRSGRDITQSSLWLLVCIDRDHAFNAVLKVRAAELLAESELGDMMMRYITPAYLSKRVERLIKDETPFKIEDMLPYDEGLTKLSWLWPNTIEAYRNIVDKTSSVSDRWGIEDLYARFGVMPSETCDPIDPMEALVSDDALKPTRLQAYYDKLKEIYETTQSLPEDISRKRKSNRSPSRDHMDDNPQDHKRPRDEY